jgi:4-amino-4-deoxy-L-arabinose transferase-like glycosyltransferase
VRAWAPLPWLTAAAFAGAFLSRAVWFYRAGFHPDESTVLWMALDAVRDIELPDHGLISSYGVYQPPGMVWVTMPFVALGGGRPELVIVGFAVLNAAGIALLVATVGRAFGLAYAGVLATFLIVGPDAFFSAAVWHPSLYTGAMGLLLTAGIRLRSGSRWWAAVLVGVPGVYALAHYSGVVMFAPTLALLVLSRRAWRQLVAPAVAALGVVVCAWVPFLLFEVDRAWLDVRTILDAGDSGGSPSQRVGERLDGLWFAFTHLGQSLHGPVDLTWVLWALIGLGLAIAVARGRWREPSFILPAVVIITGLVAEVVANQGPRQDVLMLWLVPWYALAACATAEIASLARDVQRRWVVSAAVAVLALVVGGNDLANAIRATPYDQRLNAVWHVARTGVPVDYPAAVDPATSVNTKYIPCDPPYDWGSEVWYLREVLHPGSGLSDAVEAGAFRWRRGPPCAERLSKLRPK